MGYITTNSYWDALLIILLLLSGCYTYFTWNFDYWRKRNVPFIKPLPVVGNFLDVLRMRSSIGGYLAEAYHQMPNVDYFGIWVFRTPHLVVRSPDVIRHILVKDFNHFADRTITSDARADSLISQVIFVMKQPLWRAVRAKLTPIFTTGKIKHMVPLINAEAKTLKKYIDKNGIEDGLDVKELCARFTTNVVTSCAFGVRAKSFNNANAAFRHIGRRMFDFNLWNAARGICYFFAPSLVRIFRLRFFEKGVNEFCRDAFWQAINERKASGAKRNDIIDIIIEMIDSNELAGDEAVAQAVQFFAAGFETTSSAIAYTLYELAQNDYLQHKVRNEIGEACNELEEIDYETIKNLPLLEQILKETLRKYPVLPFLDRRCIEDYKLPNSDLVIEKGTPVYIPIYGMHYDEQHFYDPDVYDPQRFDDANMAKMHPLSYLPFGVGPRNCIGERFGLITTKLGIAHILTHFFVEFNDYTPQPIVFDPKSFVLQPLGGLPMNFIPLNRKYSIVSVSSEIS